DAPVRGPATGAHRRHRNQTQERLHRARNRELEAISHNLSSSQAANPSGGSIGAGIGHTAHAVCRGNLTASFAVVTTRSAPVARTASVTRSRSFVVYQ